MLGTLPSALSMTRLVCCLCKDDGIFRIRQQYILGKSDFFSTPYM